MTMKKILVTGGTIFVSRYIAEYYVAKGYEVYVLNRNSRTQSKGVKLIQADRHKIGSALRMHHFNLVIDTGYTSEDVGTLLDALGSYEDYIFISSSAVYPEYSPQPFTEETQSAANRYWGKYGTHKIEAEELLGKVNPNAYILRPPYLYGPMNNIYREAFVFECALADRKFYLPGSGNLKLQFFHIQDLCRFIDILVKEKPSRHIFNVGNKEVISVREWVELCYHAAGKKAEFVNIYEDTEQRDYFCFSNYEYRLDVSAQNEYMPDTKPLAHGLSNAFDWYGSHSEDINRKPYLDYIDSHFTGTGSGLKR